MNKPTMNHNLIEYILASQDPEHNETVHEAIHFMDEMPGGFLIYRMDQNEEFILQMILKKSSMQIRPCCGFSNAAP